MAESAVARLRGILARDMSRADIDQLLADVAAELLADAPTAPVARERLPMRLCWLDTSTYQFQARTCPVCGWETRWEGVTGPVDADRAMEQHFGKHIRETTSVG